MPLMGWGQGTDDDGRDEWFGLVAGQTVSRADEHTTDGYHFLLYFLRGSLNDTQEQELFDFAIAEGQKAEQAGQARDARPAAVGKSARRFTRAGGP